MTHIKTALLQDLPDLGNGRNFPADETHSAGGEGREWGWRRGGLAVKTRVVAFGSHQRLYGEQW